MSLETLWNSIDGEIPAEYDAARAAKVAEIALYLEGQVKPDLDLNRLAEAAMSSAEEMGRIRGDEISAEIAARYTISGHPLPFTV